MTKMKIDAYDFEALCDALGEDVLQWLAAGAQQLGLDEPHSWTAVHGLVLHAVNVATLNVANRDNIHLDDAAATLLAPGTTTSVRQRCTGPRKTLGRIRNSVRTK